jgi:hypothetical protein
MIGERPELPQIFQRSSRYKTPPRDIPQEPGSVSTSTASQPTPYRQPPQSPIRSQLDAIFETRSESEASDAVSEGTPRDQEPDLSTLLQPGDKKFRAPPQSSEDDASTDPDDSTSVVTETEVGCGEVEGSYSPHGKWEEVRSESASGDTEVPLIYDSDKEERLLAIPTFEEALVLWNQWRPRFHEKNIGDIVVEHLNLSQTFVDPSVASRL